MPARDFKCRGDDVFQLIDGMPDARIIDNSLESWQLVPSRLASLAYARLLSSPSNFARIILSARLNIWTSAS